MFNLTERIQIHDKEFRNKRYSLYPADSVVIIGDIERIGKPLVVAGIALEPFGTQGHAAIKYVLIDPHTNPPTILGDIFHPYELELVQRASAAEEAALDELSRAAVCEVMWDDD